MFLLNLATVIVQYRIVHVKYETVSENAVLGCFITLTVITSVNFVFYEIPQFRGFGWRRYLKVHDNWLDVTQLALTWGLMLNYNFGVRHHIVEV